ncbi:polysaccharide deacetylase family protein [Flavobacterium bizetiae]|nr:polysaccharide deacetylase family protein [Flavobacterium bizetiae]
MYHRINDDVGQKLQDLTVGVSNFENQLIYYKDKFQILKLDEDWISLKKTGVVITFDDGYADNILNALPLLEKHEIPATIFVTTLNINKENEFWWDRLVFDYSSCNEIFYLPNKKDKNLKSDSIYKEIVEKLNNFSNDEKEKWFLEFEKVNHLMFFPRKEYRSLTNLELQLLSKHPLISIGIHTHNHYPLGSLTYEQQKQELLRSLKKLNELEINPTKYLSLPHGSYNIETFNIIKELNLSGALLANNYYSSNRNKVSKKINRILIPNIKDKILAQYLKHYDF